MPRDILKLSVMYRLVQGDTLFLNGKYAGIQWNAGKKPIRISTCLTDPINFDRNTRKFYNIKRYYRQ
jgi:hypothetical protein